MHCSLWLVIDKWSTRMTFCRLDDMICLLEELLVPTGLVWSPEQLFWSECGSLRLVSWGGAAAEGVADGEDAQPAERVQREQDEDGEGDQGVHHLEGGDVIKSRTIMIKYITFN